MRLDLRPRPGASATPSALVLDGEGPVQNNVTSGLLVRPPAGSPDVNGVSVKAPDAAWGVARPYGKGNAFELIEEGEAPVDDQTATGPVLFRVDRDGGLGCMGVHVATGLRRPAGTQCVWIDPHGDTAGLVITTPTVADAPAHTKPLLVINDQRGAAYTLFSVEPDGLVKANKGIRVQGRLAADTVLTIQNGSGGATAISVLASNGTTELFNVNSQAITIKAGTSVQAVNDAGNAALAALYSADTPAFAIRGFLNTLSAGTVGLVVKLGNAAPTADAVQIQNNAGAPLSRINKAGYIITKKNAAPVLADLTDGEVAFWLDTAGNAFKLAARIGGVLKTGTVAVA